MKPKKKKKKKTIKVQKRDEKGIRLFIFLDKDAAGDVERMKQQRKCHSNSIRIENSVR